MDNRTLILDRSLELFAARGYDSVGVQEIVEAAGVTKPTLYHYFGSKQGLLDALLSHYYDEFNHRLEQAADYQGDLTGTLRKVAWVYFHYALENPVYYRFQLALWFAPRDSEAHQRVSTYNETQYRLVEDLFTHAVRNHGNMRGRQRLYAASFIGLLNTYIGLAFNNLVEIDEDLVTRALHQFEHGIYS